MDYLGHYREWKGEAMTGPDAEFAAQLVEKNAVAVEERSRMKQENKRLKAKIEELESAISWAIHHMSYQAPETPLTHAWQPCYSRLSRALEATNA